MQRASFLFLVPSVFLLLVPQLLQITTETKTVMATDHCTATLALPRFLLLIKEFLYSTRFDELQVFYHTHPVAGSVSFVNSHQSVAGKAFALVTKGDFTFGQFRALFLQKRTLLVPWSAAYAVSHPDTFCFHIMLQSQIA
jgi:hypothetical protein